ncbi:MAG TPA: flippase [Armatimonadota bacterium]|jgi:O-antigen/teichoic acid export membrane protein
MSDNDLSAYNPEAPPPATSTDVQILARGAGLGLVGGIVRQALAALVMFALARLLTGDQFGLVQLGISCTVLLAVVGKAGVDLVVTRLASIYLINGEHEKVKGLIYGSLLWTAGLSTALAIAVTVWGPTLADFFNKDEFAAPLVAFVWWVPLAGLTIVITAAVLARGSARARVVARDLTVPAVFLVLAIVAGAWHKSAAAVGVAYSVSALVGLGLGVYYLRRFYPQLGAVKAHYQNGLLLAAAWPLMLTDLAGTSLGQADVVTVGRMLAAHEVGIYAAAARLAAMGTLALLALNQITGPVISRLHHQGRVPELNTLLKSFTRLCLAFSVPVLALLIGMPGPMMGLLGHRFVEGQEALQIVCLGVLLNVATGSVGVVLMMTGRQWLAFATNVGSVGLLVGMIWWLTPIYGVTGAAMGLSLSTAIANLVRLALVRGVLGVNPMSLPMAKSLAAGAVLVVLSDWAVRALGLTGHEGFWFLFPWVLLLSVLGGLLYLGLLLLMRLESSDRAAIKTLADRLRQKSSG